MKHINLRRALLVLLIALISTASISAHAKPALILDELTGELVYSGSPKTEYILSDIQEDNPDMGEAPRATLPSSVAAYGPEDLFTACGLYLRTSPKYTDNKIVLIPKGSNVTVIGRASNGWYYVTYNGKKGYVQQKYLTMPAGTKLYTTIALTLRTAPSSSSEKIVVMKRFKPVDVLEENNAGWYKVKYDGYTGYASSKYLTRKQQGVIDGKTTCNVWLRSTNAFSDDNKLVLVPKGSTVKIIGGLRRDSAQKNAWYKVSYQSNEGWIADKYLEDIYPLFFYNGATTVTVTKEWFRHAYVYAAHIQTNAYTRMGMYDPSGKYDNKTYTTSWAASKLGAILCVNGDYSAKVNDWEYIAGIARQGKVLDDFTCWAPGFYNNHTGKLYLNSTSAGTYGRMLSELVAEGLVTDTINFYYTTPVKDGESQVPPKYDTNLRPRTLIGTNEKAGDIWLIVADGDNRDAKSIGLNQKDRADILLAKGCTLGFGMDGGGSSTMVFCGLRLTALKNGTSERPIIDFWFCR